MDFEVEIKKLVRPFTDKEITLEVPPAQDMGDYAFPCFSLASTLKKSPQDIAEDISKKIRPNSVVERITAVGPYINFFVNKEVLVKTVFEGLKKVPEKKQERIMVEYSGPNPFKGFHIGHVRNTVLGDALIRILRHQGYAIIAVNYLNDTGLHVAKALWAFLRFHKDETPPENKGEWLGEIYAEAEAKLNERPELKKEVQEIYKKIENKDPEVLKQFKEKKKWSEDDFNKIYEELNVNFDRIYYDSDYIAKGKGVVSELAKKGIAVKDEGAMLVDLEKYNLQKVLVLRSDQTALYITKDVAMAMERINEFNLDRLVYVVGAEQQLHFRQLFKILELHGFEQAKKCFHLSYELVRLQDARMSSRKGSIILYSTLRDAVVKHAREEVEKRHPDWSEEKIENSAGNIALAAIKFTMLHQDNNKVIKFDIQKALDFEGETGPYIQYTHARINSILRKYNDDIPNIIPVLKETHEFALIKLLHKFNMVIKHAAESYKPPLLTYYLLELSRAFNEFYHACPVLKSEESVRNNRIVLINAVKEILQKGLTLLGIPAPQEM